MQSRPLPKPINRDKGAEGAIKVLGLGDFMVLMDVVEFGVISVAEVVIE